MVFQLETGLYNKPSLADYFVQGHKLAQDSKLNNQKIEQGKLQRAGQYIAMATPENWQSIRQKAIEEGLGTQQDVPMDYDQNWINSTKTALNATSGSQLPSAIQEFNLYKALSPTDQEEYIKLKRGNQYLNMGDAFIDPRTGARYEKGISPDQQPSLKGEQQDAENASDLRYKPEITKQTELSKTQAEKISALPSAISNADLAIKTIDDALAAPGFNSNFGIRGVIPNVPGTEAADAKGYLDQIGGQAFLDAYGSLRGGGAITEAEGKKAEQARVRLQKAQSPEAARKALNELRDVVIAGRAKAIQSASSPSQMLASRPSKNTPITPAQDDVDGQMNYPVQDPPIPEGNYTAEETTTAPSSMLAQAPNLNAPTKKRTVVKTQYSPSTGKRKIIYSDGTEEIQ